MTSERIRMWDDDGAIKRVPDPNGPYPICIPGHDGCCSRCGDRLTLDNPRPSCQAAPASIRWRLEVIGDADGRTD